MIDWPLEDRLKIIKNFKPLEEPSFDNGEEDAFRYVVWNIYSRICDAIKSFVILYENNCFYDAYTIAGYMLETCSLLCYIRSEKTEAENRNNYNKYLASVTLDILKKNLKTSSENFEKDIEKASFISNLKVFYPVGKTILVKNGNYEEVIQKINSINTSNKERRKILKDNFVPLKVSNYIDCLSNTFDNNDDGWFKQFYYKYCALKHNNIIGVNLSFEEEFKEETKSDMLYLVLGILTYLDKYFKFD